MARTPLTTVTTVAILSAAIALGMMACGGSSSETPWPVEPIDTNEGPAGEDLTRGNIIDVKKLPNRYPTGEGGAAAEDGDEGGAAGE